MFVDLLFIASTVNETLESSLLIVTTQNVSGYRDRQTDCDGGASTWVGRRWSHVANGGEAVKKAWPRASPAH